jgi:hypothetical protein
MLGWMQFVAHTMLLARYNYAYQLSSVQVDAGKQTTTNTAAGY